MSKIEKAKTEPLKQIWTKLEALQTVMLGSPDPHQHMQPMTANPAPDENAVWFYTRKDTDLAIAARNGGTVHMCLVDGDDSYFACISGHLNTEHSQDHVDRFWNTVASAWFPEGKADPDLTMLKFTPREAAVWAGTGNPIRFGWEIAKSNMTGSEPDVGYTTSVSF